MSDEPYAQQGLSASQLETALKRQADDLIGEVVGVVIPGRGAVLWHDGAIQLVGPVRSEFRQAVDALLDGTPGESGTNVRDTLLSMGGARLVVHRLIVSDAGVRPQ